MNSVAAPSIAEDEPQPGWRRAEQPLAPIRHDLFGDEQAAFYLLTAASFIESGSHLYGKTLSDYFVHDPALSGWVRDVWEPEERKHGRALRDYVEAAWPGFPWEWAFARFLAEYGPSCTLEELQKTPVLELVARCMVETGTSCYYRAVRDAFAEPQMVRLMHAIAGDEVGHFRAFYRAFRRHAAQSGCSRFAIARVLVGRMIETRTQDTDCAIRHVHQAGFRIPGAAYLSPAEVRTLLRQTLRPHFPFRLAVDMLLRPLSLPNAVRKSSTGLLVQLAPLFL